MHCGSTIANPQLFDMPVNGGLLAVFHFWEKQNMKRGAGQFAASAVNIGSV